MRNYKFILLILLGMMGFLSSCKKDPVSLQDQTEQVIPTNLSVYQLLGSDTALLSWNGNGTSYEIHVTNMNTKEVFSKAVSDTFYRFSEKPGVYTWIVKSFLNGTETAWSQSGREFVLSDFSSKERGVLVDFGGLEWTATRYEGAIFIYNGKEYVWMGAAREDNAYPFLEIAFPLVQGRANLANVSDIYDIEYREKTSFQVGDHAYLGDWSSRFYQKGSVDISSFDAQKLEVSLRINAELSSSEDCLKLVDSASVRKKSLEAVYKCIPLIDARSLYITKDSLASRSFVQRAFINRK